MSERNWCRGTGLGVGGRGGGARWKKSVCPECGRSVGTTQKGRLRAHVPALRSGGEADQQPSTARELLRVILNDLTDEQCEEALAVWEEAGIGTVGSV